MTGVLRFSIGAKRQLCPTGHFLMRGAGSVGWSGGFSPLQGCKVARPGDVEATVLGGKGEVRIFEEAVHEDDEFAHDGGHGDEGLFAVGAQAEIKFLEES